MSNIGRNDPCPCGSGKKYKKCCLLKSYSEVGRESSINNRIISDILAFTKKNYKNSIDEAYEYFWDDFDPGEYLDPAVLTLADINFWEWFIHDWQVDEEGGKTLMELYMEKTKGLAKEKKSVLSKMKDAVISLYEVQEIFPEEGLILKDLLLGEDYRIKEKQATKSLKRWDILASRILLLDDHYKMSGCIYPYPMQAKEMTIKRLRESFTDCKKDHPGVTMRDFLKQNSDLFNYYWYENIRAPIIPSIKTTHGEPLLFSKAVFEVKDREVTVQNLKKIKGLEEIKEGFFQWLDKRKRDGSAIVLGTIKLKSNALSLECNSKERLERGKSFLLEHLSGSVTHKADILQDPFQAIKNNERKLPMAESRIPKEVEKKVYSQYMQKYYEKWLNEKLPALKGKTPIETVKIPYGKKKVAELLKSIENAEEHKKHRGEAYFDTSWLWERLGLER